MKKSRTVLGLSGGIGSTTLLHKLINDDNIVYPVMFKYNTKMDNYKEKAVRSICHHYRLQDTLKIINMPFMNQLYQSNLSTLGRNLIFLSVLAGYAESIGAERVAIAVHKERYANNLIDFVARANLAVILSSDGKVKLYAPFVLMEKFEILKLGYSYFEPPPYHLTRSCCENQELSCGRCTECIDRLEAFKRINRRDLIKYEGR